MWRKLIALATILLFVFTLRKDGYAAESSASEVTAYASTTDHQAFKDKTSFDYSFNGILFDVPKYWSFSDKRSSENDQYFYIGAEGSLPMLYVSSQGNAAEEFTDTYKSNLIDGFLEGLGLSSEISSNLQSIKVAGYDSITFEVSGIINETASDLRTLIINNTDKNVLISIVISVPAGENPELLSDIDFIATHAYIEKGINSFAVRRMAATVCTLSILASFIALIILIVARILKRRTTLALVLLSCSIVIFIASFFTGIAVRESAAKIKERSTVTASTTEKEAELDNSSFSSTRPDKKEAGGTVSTVGEESVNSLLTDPNKLTADYKYLSVSDWQNHSSDILGRKVYIIASVGEENTDDPQKLKLSIPDTYHFGNARLAADATTDGSTVPEDINLVIAGEIASPLDAALYLSPQLENAYVITFGDDCSKYAKSETDPSISALFTAGNDSAAIYGNEKHDLTTSEYKKQCQAVDSGTYEKVLRNPDQYRDKYVKLSGSVNQIIEGFFNTYTLYISDSADNLWECSYYYEDGESHAIEGDTITIYGKLNGTTTSTTVLGRQVTLPYIEAEYLDIAN